MGEPLFDELDLAELRDVVESDLVHEAALDTPVTTTLSSQEDVTAYARGEPGPALLTIVGAQQDQLGGARGIRETWALKLPLATPARPGMRAYVTGTTDEVDWFRYVEITADLGLTNRLARLFTVVDVELNQ